MAGYSEEQVILASACEQLGRIGEAASGLFNVVDMMDATTWTNDDGTPQYGQRFSFAMAYGQALMRPSATACAYIYETQLRMIRASSRAFATLNPYWMAVRQNRIAYAVGTGHVWSIVSRRDGKKLDDSLRWKVSAELELFCKTNKYRRRQGEKLTRLDRDGEFFLRYFRHHEDGVLRVRFVEPILVQDPPGHGPQDDVWFGIQFDGSDYETPLRYHVRTATYTGTTSDIDTSAWTQGVPAEDIQHRTANVDIGSPRGLPSTYPLQETCQQAVSTLKSMGRLVDIRARIALIRKQVNATLGQIQPLLQRNRIDQTKTGAGTWRNAFQFPYASIIDTNDQRTYEFPSQNIETDKIVHSLKADLQAVAAAMGLADFTISGDSSQCHDPATELLTKRGWLKHDQLQYGDEAGTVNPGTGQFEWQEIQQIHQSHYSGEMVRFANKTSLDMLVTPNHRMYASVRHSTRIDGKKIALPRKPWDFVRAGEFVAQTALPNHCLPKGGIATECFSVPGVQYSQGLPVHKHMRDQTKRLLVRTRPDRMVPMSSWLSFLGWFVAEGWTNNPSPRKKEYTVCMSQSLGAPGDCASIRKAFLGLRGYNVHENECHGRTRALGREYESHQLRWTARDKSLWSWLREHCGTDSYRKKIPAFVNDLPAGQQALFLDAAILGDGHLRPNGTREYNTVSHELADGMQSLAVQCGFGTSLRGQRDGRFVVTIGKNRKQIVVRDKDMSRVPYDGIIWCVSVPNGIIVTRRNGKVAIAGNSFANALVKEGPMDKAISCTQQDLIEDDIEVFEVALDVAAGAGRLPNDVLKAVRIDILPPPVINRSRIQDAQADEILVRNGAMSPDTMAMKHNLDPEDERAKRKANPPPEATATGDTRSHQASASGKPTARGVPTGAEPGPDVNPQKAEG